MHPAVPRVVATLALLAVPISTVSAAPPPAGAGPLDAAVSRPLPESPAVGASRLAPRGPAGLGPQVVFGEDGRERVDPDRAPYTAIGHLLMQFGSEQAVCTGFLISADTVATAAHCVYDQTSKAWASGARFYPAVDGLPTRGVSPSTPFGSCAGKSLITVTGYIRTGATMYDYAVVKLRCDMSRAGRIPLRGTVLVNRKSEFTISGYPADKLRAERVPGTSQVRIVSATQWRHDGPLAGQTPFHLMYRIDTKGGQSGSPVLGVAGDCRPCAYGIHSGFTGSRNIAVRFYGQAVSNLRRWAR